MIYFCPTPIGNLSDITIRTLEVLKKCDVIFAEDTRVSIKLLNHYNISKKLMTYHKFNEKKESEIIIELAKEGKEIAIVTDAGMPGISDPGQILVVELIKEDIDFEVLPGANAALTALVGSGLSTDHFYFYGFTNQKKNKRREELDSLKYIRDTLIFYEAPHRIEEFLEDLYEVLGDRKISVARELTKLHEERIHGKVSDVLKNKIIEKGEFVIICEGSTFEEIIDIEKLLKEKLAQGMKKSQAVKEISQKYNISKNEVYRKSLDLNDWFKRIRGKTFKYKWKFKR